MTSWAYPFEGLLITVMIRSKLLYRVHKALYDLVTADVFSPISYYYPLAL